MAARRRALFIQPPLLLGRDFIDYPWFADFAVLCGAARVARAGWHVEVADAFALPGAGRHPEGEGWLLGIPHRGFLDALPRSEFDLVVVGNSPFLRAHRPDPRVADLVAGIRSRYPGAALVLADSHPGGMHHVAAGPDAVLGALPGVDAWLRFAGEESLSDPDRLLALRGARTAVDEPAGPWDRPPPFPLLEALDGRAYGAFLWRCFADGRWANPFGVDAATRPFLASSGCPHRCTFCSSNPGWESSRRKAYRTVPLDVVEQWAVLSRGLGARKLFVLDDAANQRPDFEGVLDAMDRAGLRYEFPNGLRADRLDERILARLKDRISVLWVSAESADAGDLAGPIGKHLAPEDIERVASQAQAVGLPLRVHWIVGFPWETREKVLATLRMAWDLHEKYGARPSVQFATPLPGTRLHDECVRQGLVPAEGLDATDAALFQHRPAFVPPAIPAGWLESARGTLQRRLESSGARKVIVNVTYECINKCEFCAVANRVRRAIPWERLVSILDEHRAQGIENLDLDGGEPTLHARLLDAIRHARATGYRQVTVTTNGRRLKDRDFAAGLLSSGITGLLVSLHGSTAKVHDGITGVKGSFDETLAGIRNVMALRDPALDVGVNVTIARRNVEDVGALVDLVYGEGVRKVNLQWVTPFGAAGMAVVPPEERAAAAVRDVIDRYRDRMQVLVVNAAFCQLPGYEEFLAADVQKMGRTMVFVTDEEVNLFEYLAGRRVRVPECATCAWALICEGRFQFPEGYADGGHDDGA